MVVGRPGWWLLVRSAVVEGDVVDIDTIWAWTAEERRRASSDMRIIAEEAWNLPSLCDGWRCRDVLGHLVWLAESTRPRALRDLTLACRPPNLAIRHIGRRLGDGDVDRLLDRLDAAAAGRFHLPGVGPQAALAEVLIHRADIVRATEGLVRSSDERTRLAIETCLEHWWFYRMPRRVRSAHLIADDAGFEVGPADGPEVRGPGWALLLALAGRQRALPELHGAVEVLR